MRKIAVFLFIVFMTISSRGQFTLKGGVLFTEEELTNYVVTGQFYKELLVVSGDLYVPLSNSDNLSGNGRIGLGFGSDRFRISTDLIVGYVDRRWRCGCGAEANLRLCGAIGVFARWSRIFHIVKKRRDDHQKILWDRGRSEISFGLTFDLSGGRY